VPTLGKNSLWFCHDPAGFEQSQPMPLFSADLWFLSSQADLRNWKRDLLQVRPKQKYLKIFSKPKSHKSVTVGLKTAHHQTRNEMSCFLLQLIKKFY